MELLTSLLTAANSMTPLGLAALLGVVIFLQVKNQRAVMANQKGVAEISGNHLSGLPDMANDLRDIKALLQNINDNVIYVRARINGRDSK
jgi:hypothetical protein